MFAFSFLEHVRDNPPTSIIGSIESTKLKMEAQVKYGKEKDTSTEKKIATYIKDKIVAEALKDHETTEQMAERIWKFEEKVRNLTIKFNWVCSLMRFLVPPPLLLTT